MKCIVGLGNPGHEYAETRHNIGFRVVAAIAETAKIVLQPGTGEYYSGSGTYRGADLLLVLPTTYMNNSGSAVREVCSTYGLTADNVLVVLDDFQIPFGTLRLRPQGSDGGHNGLGSIIYHLETDIIARLRVGVGGATLPEEHTHAAMAEYVLTCFEPEEEQRLPTLLGAAAEACLSWARDGVPKTMNAFNKNFFSDSVES